jgi:hypothetical protein
MAINYQYQGPKITNRNLMWYLNPSNEACYHYPYSSSLVYDTSKNNFSGSLVGTTNFSKIKSYSEYPLNNFNFNGTFSYINIENQLNDYIQVSSSFSIQFVLNCDNFSSQYSSASFDYGPVILGSCYDSVINNGIQIRILSDGSPRLILLERIDDFTLYYFFSDGGTPLTTNTWNVLTTTYDGSGLSSGISIYVNGIKSTTSTAETTPLPTNIYSTGSYFIGSSPEGGQFSGSISLLEFYNTQLSPEEVYANYLAIKEKYPFIL